MREWYEQYKGLLFRLSYQMTGSAVDAEDVVQDVFLKLYKDGKLEHKIEQPKSYLCKMAANRCRDLMLSARKRRERYFGEWLPEPLATSQGAPYAEAERKELLSYALLVLLERLTPLERAVFVLRGALEFEYDAIAGIMEKSEVSCRKTYSRAKAKLGIHGEIPQSEETSGEWIAQFLGALQRNQIDTVVSMLAEDVTLISDGGGKAVAAVHPLLSRDRVMRFLLGLVRKAAESAEDTRYEVKPINGNPGLLVRTGGRIETVVIIHTEDGIIRSVYMMRNPDKLRHLE